MMSTGLAKLPQSTVAQDSAKPAAGIHDQQQRLHLAFQRPIANAFFARFAMLNLIGVALVAAAWAEGLLLKPYRADTSHMCYLITVLFGWGLICCLRKDWQSVRWAGNALVYLGMVGTVLGLIITVSDLSSEASGFEDFKQVVSSIYIGSATALYTNLLACIGYLWLGTNAHLLARQEV